MIVEILLLIGIGIFGLINLANNDSLKKRLEHEKYLPVKAS